MKKICNKCGKTYLGDDIFCPNCGTKLVEVPKEDISYLNSKTIRINNNDNQDNVHTRKRQFNKNRVEENPNNISYSSSNVSKVDTPSIDINNNATVKKSNTLLKITILIVALILICVIVFLVGFNHNKSNKIQDSIVFLYNEDNQPIVFCNNQCYSDMNGITKTNYNPNKTALGIIDDDNTLWLINKNGKFRVDNDVYTFEISLDGNSVVYTTSAVESKLKNSDGVEYSTGYLKLYDLSNQQSKIIDNDIIVSCSDIGYDLLAISPKGKSICYTKDIGFNKSTNSITWKNYAYCDEITSNFTDQSLVYNINDDATMCYWDDTSKKSLYYGNILTDSVSKLSSYDEEDSYNYYISLYFNNDCSQCIMSTNEKSYIIEGQQEKESIGSFSVNAIYNGSSGIYYSNIINVDSFNNCIIKAIKDGENKNYYLSKNKQDWSYSEISNKSYYYDISADTKYLYGIKNSTSQALHKTNVADITDETEIALHVNFFEVSQNEKYIYYIDEDKVLYCYDGKNSTKIDIDVSYLYQSNNIFYYIKDIDSNYCGTLYCSYNGKSGERVKNGNDVYEVFPCESGVLFVSVYNTEKDKLGTLYKIEDKTNSLQLEEDVYSRTYYED